ncbi:40S ribosomal protein S17-like [Quillaja saponaria]|uniref:40S ribosomal protein S17-like n=1 Tax=Quillaja saponaria TaxID=32244 RepID=A0AAD7Q7B0_QUISA|nr:40S ribosomal protein S17-like [Quillaja saponaria]
MIKQDLDNIPLPTKLLLRDYYSTVPCHIQPTPPPKHHTAEGENSYTELTTTSQPPTGNKESQPGLLPRLTRRAGVFGFKRVRFVVSLSSFRKKSVSAVWTSCSTSQLSKTNEIKVDKETMDMFYALQMSDFPGLVQVDLVAMPQSIIGFGRHSTVGETDRRY